MKLDCLTLEETEIKLNSEGRRFDAYALERDSQILKVGGFRFLKAIVCMQKAEC